MKYTTLLLLVLVACVSACAPTRTVKNPEVIRTELLPEPAGFAFDKDYSARSLPEARFYDYAYSANKVLTLPDAETLVRKEMNSKGWEFVRDDKALWESDRIWVTHWRRHIRGDRWDVLAVKFMQEFDGRNVDKAKASIVYTMGSER
ncbi:MAG: hypothetical protein KDB07_08945 [Planctomycetes bacterium]|nr:hypothetical protein [Planctomycetota bacterium]